MDSEDRTGRERKERLRARRDEAGMAQVSGWVPKDRRAYAREVIAALARGANSLPPDPAQAAALDMALAEAGALRVELEKARVAGERAREDAQERTVEVKAATVRAEVAERDREEAMRELAAVQAEAETLQERERAAQEAADALRGELAGIKGRGGWRGVLLRLASARTERHGE